MSALERPAEVLLVALFDEAERAGATARAVLHSGLDEGRVAVLARETGGAALGAVPPGAVLRLPRVGRVVVRGMLAREMAAGPVGVLGPLGTALRRLGLSVADVPRPWCLATRARWDSGRRARQELRTVATRAACGEPPFTPVNGGERPWQGRFPSESKRAIECAAAPTRVRASSAWRRR